MYYPLLLQLGGGIDPVHQSIERNRNDINIIIGLGGTGVNSIGKIKERVYSTLKPDNPGAVSSAYSNIHLTGIDSDYSYMRWYNRYSLYPLNDEEFLLIHTVNLSKAMATSNYSWHPEEFCVKAIRSGERLLCRQGGRFTS